MIFSRFTEFQQLLIAWLVLGFCFSAKTIFNSIYEFPMAFISSLIAVGAGFLGHELAHKFIAQKFSWKASFKLWPQGLLLALFITLISGGQFIFAAPGAVYLVPTSFVSNLNQARKEFGLVSLSGPLMNIIFAVIFFTLGQLSNNYVIINIFFTGFYINLFLAAFNMIPFSPLDGTKIFLWNKLIWAIVALPTWITLIFILSGYHF